MIKFLTIIFLLSAVNIFSQSNKFGFDFDYAQFGYDTTSNYIEVYYEFDQNDLNLHKTDTANYVQAALNITIMDSSKGDTVLNKSWQVVQDVKSDTASQNRSLVGKLGFVVREGTYKIVVMGRDAGNPLKTRDLIDYLHVKPFIGNKPSISDIQLASNIIQDSQNKNSIFYKNTYEVIPMPSLVFGENRPVLFYYIEIYNLKYLKNDPLELERFVYNSSGKLVNSKKEVIHNTIDSRVEVGVLPVNKLPTDSYNLVEDLMDSTAKFGISSSKRFYIYNPNVVNKDTNVAGKTEIMNSEFSVMSAEELNDLFEKSKYIATNAEIDSYNKLTTLIGKRRFMYEFWKSRDADPSTPRNEFYQDYLKRLAYCQTKFSTPGQPGWQSDRGRVYLTYGVPSEIDKYPNQNDMKPYEIWHYNDIEGGVIFIFADLNGFSKYTLINSTKRGEVSDDNWQQKITIN
jgi:GWxTD domain-containing protein